MSNSDANLVDSASGNFPSMEKPQSDVVVNRLIVVSNQLPVKATRRANKNGGYHWDFTWDENSIYMHIKDGFPDSIEVFYVGTLTANVDPSQHDDVASTLLERFNCVPVFLEPEVMNNYYYGFCKQFLWPVMHYMLPFSDINEARYDRDLWNAYVTVNQKFSYKVAEAVDTDDDHVWIHDYHLMILPTFLRVRLANLKIGFFLHSPFPSSEVYRSVPVRTEILKSLLNADLIGFHTFDYARHFLSCCTRMLGLECQLKRGHISLEYNGRSIGIEIKSSGVNVGQMESVLRQPDTKLMVRKLEKQFKGKTVLLGVDDLDVFKGINFKILAMEEMLKKNPNWWGHAVLVQILNPARGRPRDVAEIKAEIITSCERINNELGSPGYAPIVLINRPVSLSERAAFYSISEAAIVTPLRDGMNLIPFEYVVSREAGFPNLESSKKSMLVVSEFIGCSTSLRVAKRVNPWDIVATADAMNEAILASDPVKELDHMKHYEYILTHDVGNWSRSFVHELERICINHPNKKWITLGLGVEFRVMAFDPEFKKLTSEILENAYKNGQNRAILLDYDRTKPPTDDIISIINKLCDDPKNTVFLISGRSKEDLGTWFGPCEKLAIAAEHGYFIRWTGDQVWETCGRSDGFDWMKIAELIMEHYTEATDGSFIEKKETAMVWHYDNTDPWFGSNQANELSDHLENVLANEPVAVKRGQYIVEVKPQGVTKGTVTTKVFASMVENGKQADFVLGIGDDKSDEDMFVAITDALENGQIISDNSVFACRVGMKPSAAEYFLDDTDEVITMLGKLGHLDQ